MRVSVKGGRYVKVDEVIKKHKIDQCIDSLKNEQWWVEYHRNDQICNMELILDEEKNDVDVIMDEKWLSVVCWKTVTFVIGLLFPFQL